MAAAWHGDKGVYILGIVAAFLTSVYIFRLIFITFLGKYRGGEAPQHGEHVPDEPHESPVIMVVPMLILAAGAIAAGLANLPGFSILGIPESWMSDLLTGHGEPFPTGIAVSSSLVAALGIVVAYAIYVRRIISPEKIMATFSPIHRILARKYYMDEIYETGIVRKVGMGIVARGGDIFDRNVVDRIVNRSGFPGPKFRGRHCQTTDGSGTGLRGRNFCRSNSHYGRLLVRDRVVKLCLPAYSA